MGKVVIELREGVLPSVTYRKENALRQFEMNHDDLLRLIKESYYKETKIEVLKPKFITPNLPIGTIKYSRRTDDADIFTIYQPKSVHPVTFEKTLFEYIPIPSLLITFIVKNQKLIKTYMFAVKDSIMLPHTPLYVFPFSNVYYNDGALCYYNGDVKHETLTQFERWFYHWVREPFNNHLYDFGNRNEKRTKSNVSLRELFMKLNNLPEFPDEELIQSKWTYESFIKNTYGEEDEDDKQESNI